MEEKKLEFRGGRAMALVPFVIFIVVTIGLSFANFQDIDAMVTAGMIALLIGMIFCKSLEDYWEVVLRGLGSKVAMTAVMLWLVVGMYGAILKSGHIVEGLVWLSVKLGLSGAVFTVCAFVFAALFAVATGSGFGTISTSSITGMICDGGNQGCTMKGVAACDTAFRSVEFALKGVHIDKAHGINGATPEDTMRNMGLIASPGMVQTEKTIVEIFENKLK